MIENFQIDDFFNRLSRSKFRSRFTLDARDRAYLAHKGFDCVMRHGEAFISKRLKPAFPDRDGRQTPLRGHPIFVAQHATGACCRSCLEKWHGFPSGVILEAWQERHILNILGFWLEREASKNCAGAPKKSTEGAQKNQLVFDFEF